MQISSNLVPEFKLNPCITTKDCTRCCKDALEVNKKKTPKEKISMTFMGLRICCGYNTSDQKYNM